MGQAGRACTIAASPMSAPASVAPSASGLDALPETAVSGARSTTAACPTASVLTFCCLVQCWCGAGAGACHGVTQSHGASHKIP